MGSTPRVLVLMGVSGCGKSTVAALLAARLGWAFEEGDALHPPANVATMAAGDPLTDEDRWPWLQQVAAWIDGQLDRGENGIVACSALKRSYRDLLDRRGSNVVFVHLAGDRETLADRLAARPGHFMPSSLLDSQFADLEEPAADEPSLRVDVGAAPEAVAEAIVDELGLGHRESSGGGA